MNSKKSKFVVSVFLAGIFAFTGFASACSPEEYEEEGNTVKFDYNDGVSRAYSVVVEENKTLEEPAVPIRTGYTFAYWQTEKTGGQKIDFPYNPDGDVTLYACWTAQICNVTFDLNYDGLTEVKEVDYNNDVSAPEDPEREGFNFYGWRTLPDGGSVVEFPYTVKKDITFYARWVGEDVQSYNIEIDLNYEGAPEHEGFSLLDGERITAKDLTNPTRTYYKFKGWSETPDGSIIKLPYTPTGSGTLYAIWERESYTVAFRYNFTGAPSVIYKTLSVDGGDTVSAPDGTPERENYSFDGWYTTALGGEKIEFPYMPVKDTALYAHWIHDSVQTDIFQAEYVEFDPLLDHYGYSGNAVGNNVILAADTNGVYEDPAIADLDTKAAGYYVSYLYMKGDKLTFNIYSDKAVSGVTLIASLAAEFDPNLSIGPTGENAFQFMVNGVALNYNAFKVGDGNGSKDMSYKSGFREFTISTSVSLKEGLNVIELVTDNDNAEAMGGTMKAVAPMVDYIRLSNYGSATLTWKPVYDNLSGK